MAVTAVSTDPAVCHLLSSYKNETGTGSDVLDAVAPSSPLQMEASCATTSILLTYTWHTHKLVHTQTHMKEHSECIFKQKQFFFNALCSM